MTYIPTYAVDAPDRAEIDALPGFALLEFGVDWCPHCPRARSRPSKWPCTTILAYATSRSRTALAADSDARFASSYGRR